MASSSRSTSSVEKSPAWSSRSAAAIRSTHASGSRRAPRGRCVSDMTAISIRGTTLTIPAPVAQWIERCPPEPEVAGSNPAGRVLPLTPAPWPRTGRCRSGAAPPPPPCRLGRRRATSRQPRRRCRRTPTASSAPARRRSSRSAASKSLLWAACVSSAHVHEARSGNESGRNMRICATRSCSRQ